MNKICIDAGHYGKSNQSPCNKKYYESDMSWKLHLLLKSALEAYGVEVITTRSSQSKDLALVERGKKAKGCDLFLSIHSNAPQDAADTKPDYPLACCSVSGKADGIGKLLADTVARVMATKQGGRITKRSGTSRDWYGVLRGAAQVGVPGVLLEHSFHTNPQAVAFLMSDANLRRLAEAEAETIAKHYGLTKQQPADTPKPAPDTFLVKITCASLNVRAGAGTSYKINTVVHKNEVYTIVETKQVGASTWGKLKSGAGWINIGSKYCKKL